MSVKYTSNVAGFEADTNTRIQLALRYMLDAVDQEAMPNTPKKQGYLRSNVLKVVSARSGTITWAVNYAIYQENRQFKNYTTQGTGPHFAENAVAYVVKNSDVYFRKARLVQ